MKQNFRKKSSCLRMPALLLLSSLCMYRADAQLFVPSAQMGGNNPDVLTGPGIQNLGLGKFLNYPNPLDRLSIGGNLSLATPNANDPLAIMQRSSSGVLSIFSNTSETNGTGIRLWGSFAATNPGSIQFFSTANSHAGFNDRAFDFRHYDMPTQTYRSSIVVNDVGNVRIGNGIPAPINSFAKLIVDGDLQLNDNVGWDRSIYNKTDYGSMGMSVGTYYGPSIRLFGVNNNFVPGGQIWFNSNSNPGILGFVFSRSSATGLPNTKLMGLENNGLLHLYNSMTFDYEPSNTVNRQINGHAPYALFMINSGDNMIDGPSIRLCGKNYNAQGANTPGEIHFVSYGSTGPGVRFFSYDPAGQGTYKEAMKVQKDGKVVIGDYPSLTTPGNYKLYVQDGILTERVKVAVKTTLDWADYVFDKDYELMPLHTVAAYIDEHKHLPQVPSADEVVKNGVDVSEMNARLLQKIEELTLYAIKQQKLLDNQSQQLAQQQQDIEALKKTAGRN